MQHLLPKNEHLNDKCFFLPYCERKEDKNTHCVLSFFFKPKLEMKLTENTCPVGSFHSVLEGRLQLYGRCKIRLCIIIYSVVLYLSFGSVCYICGLCFCWSIITITDQSCKKILLKEC